MLNMKKNIAIVWGGYSSEKEVSEKSAEGINSFMNHEIYNIYKVKIEREKWFVENDGQYYLIDKNDFSFVLDNRKINFDFAYITIHGTPGEDGTLQGYFDMLHIPYSNCGVLASALTFSKYFSNNFFKSFGYDVAESVIVRKNDEYNSEEIINKLSLPVFVKPNVGGSSFATTKVKKTEDLSGAIAYAFEEANEVMIERFISGTEVTCGCYKNDRGIHALPISEVVSKNEFFDYNAKYNGEVEEITPARISAQMTSKIQELTQKIYKIIEAKGFIRVDYIISDEGPILLEINTTPGMTPTSFIPQQVAAAKLPIKDVLTDIIEYEYKKLN